MSRVLLVGMGVPGLVAARRHAGPGLRSAHFASALAAEGHEVLLLAVLAQDEVAPDPDAGTAASPNIEFTTERELLSAAMRARIARFAPEAVVGVTVYGAALAARLGLDVPLWADAFGDIMAEAQAKAARHSNDWSIVHFWTLLRGVLEAADRFSAVSVAQSHALVGQLGLAGRLTCRTAEENLVAVIPCAAGETVGAGDRAAARRELGFGEDDFVLLASGGVNTWCDVETLCRGVGEAMETEPRVHLLVTGGAIPGHDEASHDALLSGLHAMPRSRVHVLGWVDSTRLPGIYAAADLALHVERPLYERRLGAENRVVEWLAHGLACVTTAQSETGAALVAAGLALACRPREPGDLARVIRAAAGVSPAERSTDAARSALAADAASPALAADAASSALVADANCPALLADARVRGREWAARERGFARTAAPLLEWCADPCFARDRDGARLVRLGLLSQPQTSVEMLEAYVAQLPAHEILRRGLRWFARRVRRRLPDLLVPLLLLVSTLTGGCRGEGGPAVTSRPNVLLLSVDTLRWDHLGAYGYAVTPSPTPWMDDLASGGTLFEHAVTSAPETAPALATLLTGVYQDRHGLMFNRAKLAAENHTLAERLQEAGYATAAFVGNWLVDSTHGFAQGFDRFEVVTPGAAGPATTDDKLVALFGDFLREPSRPGPWFAWVHMMDPHGPYNSASPWWSRGFDYTRAPLSHDGEFPVSDSNFGLGVIPLYQRLEGAKLLSDYAARYDGEIRFTDSQVGSLLGMLAASGARDNTIVVLVADHGESLVEHDELLQHGWFVYDATIRVPLLLSVPGSSARGDRRGAVTCSVDIAPGILDLAGVAAEGGDFDGRAFGAGQAAGAGSGAVSRMPEDAAALRDAGCFTIGPRGNHPFALSTARHKLILTPAGTSRDPRAPKGKVSTAPESLELYDLENDPGETTNLAETRRDLVEEMQQSLTTLRSRFRAHGWRW